MKYIPKKAANEPSKLRVFRETTPDAIWKGFVDTDHLLKTALLKEQGYICAYCMKRINLDWNKKLKKPSVEVEHYKSQFKHKHLELKYSNMLGVCNGHFNSIIHCDKNKLEHDLNILNPLRKEIENLITYQSDGTIKSALGNAEIERDLNEILNLNNEELIKARKSTTDIVLGDLKKKYPSRQWTKAFFKKEIEEWKTPDKQGRFRQYCQIAVWFLTELSKKNRYPEK